MLALEAHPCNSGQSICFEEWEKKQHLSLSYFFARFGREFETWSCGACFAVGCREFRVVSSGLWNCFCKICAGLRDETKTSPKNLLITITMSVSISVASSCLGAGTSEKGWMQWFSSFAQSRRQSISSNFYSQWNREREWTALFCKAAKTAMQDVREILGLFLHPNEFSLVYYRQYLQ